jgi:hypothetical protein
MFSWAFVLMTGMIFGSPTAWADMEWRLSKPFDLKATPLDVASSPDGQRLFILTPQEILVFSFRDGKIVGQVPVDKDFDRITSMSGGNGVIISSSIKRAVQVLTFEMVYKIDVTEQPFKGPKNAPVTLVVFDDYQ